MDKPLEMRKNNFRENVSFPKNIANQTQNSKILIFIVLKKKVFGGKLSRN